MAHGGLTSIDQAHLARAVELSRAPAAVDGDLPFGAVVAAGGRVLGEAHNEVGSRSDPTAHAEILALRAATAQRGEPLLADAVLYASSEPCPMCLGACYWARIGCVVFAASLEDTAKFGFEDTAFYRELALPWPQRALPSERGDEPLRDEAFEVLRQWHTQRS